MKRQRSGEQGFEASSVIKNILCSIIGGLSKYSEHVLPYDSTGINDNCMKISQVGENVGRP